jgi:hypothetical protein
MDEEIELSCEITYMCRRTEQYPCRHYEGMVPSNSDKEVCGNISPSGRCCSHKAQLEAIREELPELEFWEKLLSGEIKTASMMTPQELKERLESHANVSPETNDWNKFCLEDNSSHVSSSSMSVEEILKIHTSD